MEALALLLVYCPGLQQAEVKSEENCKHASRHRRWTLADIRDCEQTMGKGMQDTGGNTAFLPMQLLNMADVSHGSAANCEDER